MGNTPCMNPQPLSQPVAIQPLEQQRNSKLIAGIEFVNFLQQKVQSKFFIEFKKQKGIQKFIGIPLQNLSQLYTFVQNIKNQENSNEKNLNQRNKNSAGNSNQKDAQQIIDQVKSTLFNLKRNTRKNAKLLKVDDEITEQNHIDTPFYLPWISKQKNSVSIYIGQWRYEINNLEKNLPFGIGRLYLGSQVWEGQIECSLEKLQQKEIREIKSIKQKIDNISTPITQKINLLKQNLSLTLEGLGRKFTKDQQYCGQFQKGKLNGKGQYKNNKLEYFYQGMWVDGFKQGKGIEKTKLTYYQGDFSQNKKSGSGTLIFYISTLQQRQRVQEQKQFEQTLPELPQYKQRKKRVKIQMNLQEKSDQIIRKILKSSIPKYKGQELLMLPNKSYKFWEMKQFPFINQGFVQNLKFQQSIKTYFLEKYTGQFKNDQFHGRGTYQWSKGNFYVGDWVDGKMQGQGKFFWKQGYSYYGEYKNDLKHGKGEMKWDPYKRHRGNWAFGKKHGYGQEIKIQIREDILGVSIKSGLWKNNVLNEKDLYFQKFFPFPENSLQETLFLSNIEFYYSKLKLSEELKKKLFDEKSKKFYKNPCQICGSYFLKIDDEQNQDNIWKINLNSKEDEEIQPQLCRQCQKKIEERNETDSQKNIQNKKIIASWFDD